jgi:hypothetical protein
MKRTFKNGILTINRIEYTTIIDYDLSILENRLVFIVKNPWSQKIFAYMPTEEEQRLLGTKAKFISLKRIK